jgi:long-chain fatty acid transport protein
VNFTPGGAWTLRGGVALDQSPTPNAAVRTPRLPDADRTWVTLGAGYRVSKAMSFDVSFAYLKVHDTSVNKAAGIDPDGENFLRGSISADYESETRILGAQARWQFE